MARGSVILPLLLAAFVLSGCDWSEQRCNQQQAKERLIQPGMSVAEVERILGKAEPVQADSDNPCEAAGATRQVRCLVCDSRWDSPRWWPNGSYSVDYLVICLDDGNRVRHRFHQFVVVN
jgi:hypothetical protein